MRCPKNKAMNETILIAILSSSVLSAIISGLFSLLKTKRNSNDAIRNGLQQLMFDRIKHLCKSYLKQGHIGFDDLQDLERMHKIYHDDLKGNGYLVDLMDRVRDIPAI